MNETAAPEVRQPEREHRAVWVRVGALGLLVVVWAAVSWGNQHWEVINPVLLPTPLDVVQSGAELTREGLLQQHLAISLVRVAAGFGIAATAALMLGMLTGVSPLVRFLVEPVVECLRPIPPLAFLPMFLVWFGLDESSKVAFIAYTTFFPMFVTIAAGVLHVDILLLRAASSLGATRWQLMRHVMVPSALSGMIVGLRVGFSLAIFVIVGAEFMGADSGLGYMIMEGRTFFMPAQIVMGALVLGLLGFGVNALLLRLERRLLRWRRAL